MSSWLVSSIAPAPTASVLQQLDDDDGEAMLTSNDASDAASTTECSRGPFTVFKAKSQEPTGRQSALPTIQSSLPAPEPLDEDEVVPYDDSSLMGIVDTDEQAHQQQPPPLWNLLACSQNTMLDPVAEYDGQGPAAIRTSSFEGNE